MKLPEIRNHQGLAILNSAGTTFSVRRKHVASSVMLLATRITLLKGFTRAQTRYERRTTNSNDPSGGEYFLKSKGYGTAQEGSADYEQSNTGV